MRKCHLGATVYLSSQDVNYIAHNCHFSIVPVMSQSFSVIFRCTTQEITLLSTTLLSFDNREPAWIASFHCSRLYGNQVWDQKGVMTLQRMLWPGPHKERDFFKHCDTMQQQLWQFIFNRAHPHHFIMSDLESDLESDNVVYKINLFQILWSIWLLMKICLKGVID